jgi:Fe-S oxidoreductase
MSLKESLEIRSDVFWDPKDLEKELYRVSDICHGCRLCFNLCPSFPALFDAIDDRHDGDPSRLAPGELDRVVDLCYQCQMCYVKCPYTPPHDYLLDFPLLMQRAKILRAKEKGVGRKEKFLGNTDLVGAMGSLGAPLSNWVNRSAPGRWFLEKFAGIHRQRLLPPFHRKTFDAWFQKRRQRIKKASAGTGGKVVFFSTCSVNYNYPEIGRAAVQVLLHNGVEVVAPPARCCGMPNLDSGNIEDAKANMEANVRAFLPWVERGYRIVIPQPTCSMTFKHKVPWVLGTDASRRVAGATRDLGEYLMELRKEGGLRLDFPDGGGRYAYHLPCHLKAQNIGTKSRDLLALIPGAQVRLVERCSGMDGTWGMKGEFFDESLKVAAKLFREIEEVEGEVLVSDCTLSGLQIRQGLGRPARHPVEVLRDAYGLPRNGEIQQKGNGKA